ncbi:MULTISPECIES: SDR family NAD(P)-dependent oxidoreductase [unclassified Ruegeria]|uniref:SDR family NAD(P)-dependent oxidoreductase n=1 Tax=unclassified Ruegeria TaxID=2625375 RepID=UPI0014894F9C|nr:MULTISPECIES: SDR family NAD(P)-dependent oxidoreductase [unclassified Ruegeria]NOD35031.1 SDR family NAD(P)-dependent oxidoreductase [Ruegeria sp. HKCCD7296]NOD69019.1 SDR family NAD(P)-dependent oxidoreductase [Ruegeria sp. HKCCD7303]NOE35284.1 SDR family NAD(P)-dependent oxidoreductase [Ruegeria sp. HKCCD7318]NOE41992.1 SDR family NAD(P)-dependent oxidoreductase [Ruegeria sp. HKCCD7319]
MKTALIIGASGGIGAAVCTTLESQGVSVTGLSRSMDGFDLTDPDHALPIIDGLSDPFDLILVASGALEIEGAAPEKTIRAVSAKAMMDQFALNAVGPALVLSRAHRLLPRKGRSVFAVLSARVGSIADNRMGGWISYRAAKAAVNQVVHTSAIELSRTHKQAICVALHPGTVKTAFTQKYLNRHPAVEPEVAAQNLLSVINGLTPEDTGGFFDWAGQPVPW